MKVGAALLVFLSTAAPGAASAADEEQHAHHAASSEAAQLDPQTAAVARRLWGDLVCLCDRCERLALSACHCPDAAAERKNVLALLRGRDLATPNGAERRRGGLSGRPRRLRPAEGPEGSRVGADQQRALGLAGMGDLGRDPRARLRRGGGDRAPATACPSIRARSAALTATDRRPIQGQADALATGAASSRA